MVLSSLSVLVEEDVKVKRVVCVDVEARDSGNGQF